MVALKAQIQFLKTTLCTGCLRVTGNKPETKVEGTTRLDKCNALTHTYVLSIDGKVNFSRIIIRRTY